MITFLNKKTQKIKKFCKYGPYWALKYDGLRGLCHYWDYKCTKEKNKYPYYLSIVAIAKNEAPYIAEWIEYHLLVGVEKIFLYDNESTDDLKQVLEPYIKAGIVEYTYFPGKKQQLPAYKDAIKRFKNKTKWLAFIDLDEFIIPVSTKSIPDFLSQIEDAPAIDINWLIYGSSGQKQKTEGLVMERFKAHALLDCFENRIVKLIVNPRCILKIGVHDAIYFDNRRSVDGNKIETKSYFTERLPSLDNIRINHYHCKSEEEYLQKLSRGSAFYGKSIKDISTFHGHNRNEVENDTIMDKYIPVVKSNIMKRYSQDK
jgi:hypothetical protein